MRRVITAGALAGFAALIALPAAAESHEGLVRQIRVDSESDAPLCAATSPSMPGRAWACFYPSRRHYEEMRQLLLRALDAQHRCRFEWSQRDAVTNRAQISALTCAPR